MPAANCSGKINATDVHERAPNGLHYLTAPRLGLISLLGTMRRSSVHPAAEGTPPLL